MTASAFAAYRCLRLPRTLLSRPGILSGRELSSPRDGWEVILDVGRVRSPAGFGAMLGLGFVPGVATELLRCGPNLGAPDVLFADESAGRDAEEADRCGDVGMLSLRWGILGTLRGLSPPAATALRSVDEEDRPGVGRSVASARCIGAVGAFGLFDGLLPDDDTVVGVVAMPRGLCSSTGGEGSARFLEPGG